MQPPPPCKAKFPRPLLSAARSHCFTKSNTAGLSLKQDVARLPSAGRWEACRVTLFNQRVTRLWVEGRAFTSHRPGLPASEIIQRKGPQAGKLGEQELSCAVSCRLLLPREISFHPVYTALSEGSCYTPDPKSQHSHQRRTVLLFNKLVIRLLRLCC